jgi:YD repeat-containing protein
MPERHRDVWTVSLADGRKVKYVYDDLGNMCSATADLDRKIITKIVFSLKGPQLRE